AIANVYCKSAVKRTRFFFEQSRRNLNPSLPQPRKSSPADGWIRIGCACHHPLDPRRDEGIGTRSGTSLVRTRLEVDVQRRIACFRSSLFDRQHFRVLQTLISVKTFAN